MTWSPSDTQERRPHPTTVPPRGVSAVARRAMLAVLAGPAVTVFPAIAVSALRTCIRNGL